jgi:hypothetical protein
MKKVILVALLMFFATLACQKEKFQTQLTQALDTEDIQKIKSLSENSSIFTFEDTYGRPLKNAKVLIGPSFHEPFANNFLLTDENGQITIQENFSDTPITIAAPNCIRTTFFGINPGKQQFVIRPSFIHAMIPIHGNTTGYGNLKRDNMADFGVVTQGLTRSQLLSFDMNMLISPEKDVLAIEDHKIEIPSNIAFPKQTENYIIPITFEKSNYRFFAPQMGPQKLYALHGRFPFKEVINELRKKSPFSALINQFKFIGASIKDIVADGETSLDIAVDNISFTKKLAMKTIAIPTEMTMVLIAAAEVGGKLYPLDIKKFEGSETTATLNTSDLGKHYWVAALKHSKDFYTNKPKEFGLSASITAAEEKPITYQPVFLDLIETPAVDFDAWKIHQTPQILSAIRPLATFAVLSQTHRTTKQKTLLWEAYAPAWIDQMNLPIWPEPETLPLTSRTDLIGTWEISYLGRQSSNDTQNKNFNLGPDLIQKTTHVSYNKKEF